MKGISIILADDHPIVLDGLQHVLGGDPRFTIVRTCSHGKEVIDLLKIMTVDVVITDINMPFKDGVSLTREIKLDYPDTKVIVLTMYQERSYFNRVLEAGADGCLLKSSPLQELTDAILRVQGGKSYFDSFHQFTPNPNKPPLSGTLLTEREKEVLRHIAKGMSAQEISTLLSLSEETIYTHKKNISRKLGVHGNSQLLRYALENGLL
jgi:DNA-binding NarL/FixJ family response regulator